MSKYSQKTKDQALYLFKIGFGIPSVANQLNISKLKLKVMSSVEYRTHSQKVA